MIWWESENWRGKTKSRRSFQRYPSETDHITLGDGGLEDRPGQQSSDLICNDASKLAEADKKRITLAISVIGASDRAESIGRNETASRIHNNKSDCSPLVVRRFRDKNSRRTSHVLIPEFQINTIPIPYFSPKFQIIPYSIQFFLPKI